MNIDEAKAVLSAEGYEVSAPAGPLEEARARVKRWAYAAWQDLTNCREYHEEIGEPLSEDARKALRYCHEISSRLLGLPT